MYTISHSKKKNIRNFDNLSKLDFFKSKDYK